MGVSYFVTTEAEIDGYEPDEFDGKALAKADDYLEESVCKPLGLKALIDFMGDDPRELLGEEDFEGVPEETLTEQWFDASDGIASINAMLAHLQQNPSVVQRQSAVEKDLLELKVVLEECQKNGVRWHMSMDF